jgi:dethiobiotin synthetase
MTRGVFVTGTDTGVGKTVVACALLRACVALGARAVGMKPVATGVESGAACHEDVTALGVAGNVDASLSARNPYAFAPAIAPHLAAADAGMPIDLTRIHDAFAELAARADCVIVEGAGGALVPLDARHDMLDIARVLGLPVVLVVGMRLGCLNHALLSALAIQARGLAFEGWVANCIDPEFESLDANIGALELRLPVPRLATVAWAQWQTPAWHAGAFAAWLARMRLRE